MKIALCLFKYFPYGGLQNYFLKIWEECQRRGHEIHVFAREWEGGKPNGLNLHRIPVRAFTNTGKDESFVKKLLPLLAEDHFDAVVGFNKIPGLDAYVQADICYRAYQTEKKTRLNLSRRRFRHFCNYEEAVFGPNSHTHILLISEREKANYQHYYGTPEDRFSPLPPPFPRISLLPSDISERRKYHRDGLGIGENENLILFIASSFKSKRLDRAIRAFRSLPQEMRRRSYLYVIGDDRSLKHKLMALLCGSSSRITFLGGRSDILDFLLAGDLLIHPAALENTGTVILEAITAGLPVLATDICGYATHIERSEAGKVLPSPFSQEECNRLLKEMLSSPDRALRSQNGLRYGANPPLQGMPETAVDVIEEAAARKTNTSEDSSL